MSNLLRTDDSSSTLVRDPQMIDMRKDRVGGGLGILCRR
jgi:hypothetical protein